MKHILMVDDVATNLKCVSAVLKGNYEVSMAKSGEQALEMIKAKRPDLILLDINMPDMDGYEMFAKMKENSEYADIPVVFLTADSESESELKSIKLGAVDFIRKPFAPDVMLSRIERILELQEMKKAF